MFDVTRKVVLNNTKEDDIQIGDQITIYTNKFGDFSATAEKVKEDSILFFFDDIVARRQMNKTSTTVGGFKGSDLYKWLQNVLLKTFPDNLRSRISELTIPTVGQIYGQEFEWDKECVERDNDEQLLLMKDSRHGIATYRGYITRYWLQNTAEPITLEDSFACFGNTWRVESTLASKFSGVRPAFWLAKEKHEDSLDDLKTF